MAVPDCQRNSRETEFCVVLGFDYYTFLGGKPPSMFPSIGAAMLFLKVSSSGAADNVGFDILSSLTRVNTKSPTNAPIAIAWKVVV